MTNLPIYAAALGAFLIVLQVVLMLRVGLHRAKGPAIGLGDDKDLERKVRRHGNLAENSGLFLAVLALLEILVGQTWYVAALCGLFAIARASHAFGFSTLAGSHGEGGEGFKNTYVKFRAMGALGTLLTALGAAVALVLALTAL